MIQFPKWSQNPGRANGTQRNSNIVIGLDTEPTNGAINGVRRTRAYVVGHISD